MKYISVLILVGFMALTWSMATSNSQGLTLQDHREAEAAVEQMIRDAIKAKRPDAGEVVFRQLYTEVVAPGREIRAHVRYEINAPTASGDVTSELFDGIVVLKSEDGGQTWARVDQKVSTPAINFQEGSKISPKDTETAPAENGGENE